MELVQQIKQRIRQLPDVIPLLPDLSRLCLSYYCQDETLLFEREFLLTLWEMTRGKFHRPHPSPGTLLLKSIYQELPKDDPFIDSILGSLPEDVTFIDAMTPTKQRCCHRSRCYYVCCCQDPVIPSLDLFSTYH